jgi:hypothetical protein
VNHYRAKIAGYQSELRTGNLKPSKRQELQRDERYYAEQVVAIYGRLLGHEKPKLQAITLMGDPKNPLHMTHDLSVLSDGELDALSRILPKLGGSTEADAADGDVAASPRRTTASPRGQRDGGDRKGLRKAKAPANR